MIWRILDAAMLVLGAGCVVAGVAQIYPPAAWVIGGIAFIGLGLMPTRRS